MESDHMEAADNQSLDRCSSSNYNDAFITFKAPLSPECKKAAEKVKRSNKLAKNKRKAVASSDNDAKDMEYSQFVSTLAFGLKEPLVFYLESD
jgi:hypothetical protein